MLQLLLRKSGLQCLDRRREEIFTASLINPWEVTEFEEVRMIIVRFIEDTDMTFRMVWAIPLANESIDTRAFVDILVWRKDFVACPALKKKSLLVGLVY